MVKRTGAASTYKDVAKEKVELSAWQFAAIQRALEVVRDEHKGMIESRSLGSLIEKITEVRFTAKSWSGPTITNFLRTMRSNK